MQHAAVHLWATDEGVQRLAHPATQLMDLLKTTTFLSTKRLRLLKTEEDACSAVLRYAHLGYHNSSMAN